MRRKKYDRRELFKTFGGSAMLLHPLLSEREVLGQTMEVKKRFVCFNTSSGVIQKSYWPNGNGQDYNFDGRALEPLKDFKGDINIIKGLRNDYGPFDSHSGGTVALLTGDYINKDRCKDQYCDSYQDNIAAKSASIDQMIATSFAGKTSTRSLEIALFPTAERGSKYISFAANGKIMPQFENPYILFDTIFKDLVIGCDSASAASPQALANIKFRRKSVLDSIRADLEAASNAAGLTPSEQSRLDEYQDSIRAIEKRIDALKVNSAAACSALANFIGDDPKVSIMPSNYAQVARLMIDLIVAAFQLDVTRVATVVWSVGGNDGVASTWANFNGKPINESYHALTHQSVDPTNWSAKCEILDRYHAGEFAYMLGKLKNIKEGSASLLDNSLALWTSELGEGSTHDPSNLPTVLAGRAAGAMQTGRFVELPANSKHQRLLVSILRAMGTNVSSVGNSGNVDGAV